MNRVISSSVLACLLFSGNVFAINKCIDANGRTSFQDKPCPDYTVSSVVNGSKDSKGNTPDRASDSVNEFKSVTAGFSITKPTEWQFVTAEQNLENIRGVKLNDKEFHQAMLKYSTAPLVVMMKYPEPYDDLNPSFKVNIKPFGQLKGTEPKKILEIILSQFRTTFHDFELVEPPRDTKVSGRSAVYMRIHYSLKIPDGRAFPTNSEMWLVPRGDYYFIIGAGTRQDEKTGSRAEISKILSSIVL